MKIQRNGKATVTDWDAYYNNRMPFSGFAHTITVRLLEGILNEFSLPETGKFVELGGANSTFYSDWRRIFPSWDIVLIDKVSSASESFLGQIASDQHLEIRQCDILEEPTLGDMQMADCIVSVGLIEHFSPEDTAKAIEYHFKLLKPGGVAVITYPTPTVIYKIIRSFFETINRWPFHDERPLLFDEVMRAVRKQSQIKGYRLNWMVGLTQGIVWAQKPGN